MNCESKMFWKHSAFNIQTNPIHNNPCALRIDCVFHNACQNFCVGKEFNIYLEETCAALVEIGSILSNTKVYGAFMFPNTANFYREGACIYGGPRTCEAYKCCAGWRPYCYGVYRTASSRGFIRLVKKFRRKHFTTFLTRLC